MQSWCYKDHVHHQTTVLVAENGEKGIRMHGCLSHLCLSHARPAGLLHPLPVPYRPWACISVDFVTGLSDSLGNTVILTIVDRFTKITNSILLPKLPLAKETTEVLLAQVFHLHGFARDVIL